MVKWLLMFLVGVLFGANAMYFLLTRDRAPVPAPIPALPPIETPRPAPVPPPALLPPKPTSQAPAVPSPPTATALLLPVQGVTPEQLHDSFADARGGNRVHNAIDIMAPRGTPVFAAVDGHVEKLHDSRGGGLSLYQFGPSHVFVYYYAHLQGYAPGIHEGQRVRRGEVIGFVGSTGNASADAPHLHFAVLELGPKKKWHRGAAINPYPLLSGGGSAPPLRPSGPGAAR